MGGAVARYILAFLLPILPVMAPVWPFNHDWSYGPLLAVAFLLGVNLLVLVVEFVGRRRDGSLPEYGRMAADIAMTPNPGARHAERVEAAEIYPAGNGRKAGDPVTGPG